MKTNSSRNYNNNRNNNSNDIYDNKSLHILLTKLVNDVGSMKEDIKQIKDTDIKNIQKDVEELKIRSDIVQKRTTSSNDEKMQQDKKPSNKSYDEFERIVLNEKIIWDEILKNKDFKIVPQYLRWLLLLLLLVIIIIKWLKYLVLYKIIILLLVLYIIITIILEILEHQKNKCES
jgi:hypothetical protein